MFGVFWCLSCLAFLFSSDLELPIFAHPLALASFTLLYFLNPTKIFHYRSRRWLLRILVGEAFIFYYTPNISKLFLRGHLHLQILTEFERSNEPIKCHCCADIETSQLICYANQLTRFYMRATLALNGLNSRDIKRRNLGQAQRHCRTSGENQEQTLNFKW